MKQAKTKEFLMDHAKPLNETCDMSQLHLFHNCWQQKLKENYILLGFRTTLNIKELY